MSQRTPSPKDRELHRLQTIWDAIEPPPDRLPPGFTDRVMARVHETAAGRGESLAAAPLWVRTAAAAALVLGLTGGLLMGRLPAPQTAQPTRAPVEIAESLDAEWLETDPSLAESYLALLEEPAAMPAEDGATR